MIETEEQHRITQQQLDQFLSALYAFDHDLVPLPENDLLRNAERESLLSVIRDLEEAVSAWKEKQ